MFSSYLISRKMTAVQTTAKLTTYKTFNDDKPLQNRLYIDFMKATPTDKECVEIQKKRMGCTYVLAKESTQWTLTYISKSQVKQVIEISTISTLSALLLPLTEVQIEGLINQTRSSWGLFKTIKNPICHYHEIHAIQKPLDEKQTMPVTSQLDTADDLPLVYAANWISGDYWINKTLKWGADFFRQTYDNKPVPNQAPSNNENWEFHL